MFNWKRGGMPLVAAWLVACPLSHAAADNTSGNDRVAVHEVQDPVGRIEFAEPTGPLALHDALALALVNSPALARWSIEIKIAEAEVLQAGFRPNPELGASYENFGGTGEVGGFGGSEATIALSQLVELGGKRTARSSVGRVTREVAGWDYEIARIDVLTETANAFTAVLAAQEHLTLASELAEVAEDVLESVARRVQAGATSPVEQSRARVELATSRVEETAARHALLAARIALSANWGTEKPVFETAVGNLEQVPSIPPREVLRAALEESPSIARWAAELDRREAERDLARAEGSLDVSVGAGVRYFSDTDDAAFLVELGIPLRIFDRNQGAVRAAELRVKQAEQENRAASTRMLTRLFRIHETLLAAADEVAALRDIALPEAEKAFEAAQATYLRGSIRFTDVLDTERMLFELSSRYLDALVRYHHTVSELERLTGTPITRPPGNTGELDNG
ncbi:MAG: TolC family protein [Gemmatimonadetes bacterium]|nr:TolC family protein [Gemmatimonadota bacterium]